MTTKIPLRISDGLRAELESVAKGNGLSVADVARLALERGLKVLSSQLKSDVKTPRIVLPPQILEDAKHARLSKKLGKS